MLCEGWLGGKCKEVKFISTVESRLSELIGTGPRSH